MKKKNYIFLGIGVILAIIAIIFQIYTKDINGVWIQPTNISILILMFGFIGTGMIEYPK